MLPVVPPAPRFNPLEGPVTGGSLETLTVPVLLIVPPWVSVVVPSGEVWGLPLGQGLIVLVGSICLSGGARGGGR